MKKIFILVVALALITGAAFAGDNQSAKYIRMIARETATDSIDAVYFNPAGTAFLEKGFHIQLNGQTVYLNYSHEINSTGIQSMGGPAPGTEFEMKTWIPFVPAGYLGYAGGNWSVFAGYNIPEGGGTLEYDDITVGVEGNFVTTVGGYVRGSVEASSSTHAIAVGGAWAITDWLSLGGRLDVSLATTAVDANITESMLLTMPLPGTPNPNYFNGTAELKASGQGFGGTFGVHVIPVDDMDVSITVESGQKIEVEIDDSEYSNAALEPVFGALVTDADRPWKLRAGIDYTLPFDMTMAAGFKYSFWGAVDDDKVDSWSTSLGFRYGLGEKFELSLAGSYASANIDLDDTDTVDANFTNPELQCFTVAGGIGIEPVDNFEIDLGVLSPIYLENSGSVYTAQNKTVVVIGLGLGYKF